MVKAVQATNILAVEKKETVSDAKLKIFFDRSDEKTKVDTSVNPKWNQVFKFKIDYPHPSVKIQFAKKKNINKIY